MTEKPRSLITYNNGFVSRFHNRRIVCLRRKDGDYDIQFTRCSREKFTNKQLKHFYQHIKRMGTTITIAHVCLSEEALCLFTEGWINYQSK